MAALGIGLFVLLVRSVGLTQVVSNIARIGWGFVAIVAVGGMSHTVKTWAWRFTLPPEHRRVSFLWTLRVRLAGEAVSQLSFAGQVFGETTRALMLRSQMPMVSGISSVVLDRGMYIFTGVLLIIVGALVSLMALPLSETVQRVDTIAALALLGLIVAMNRAIHHRWPALSAIVGVVGRIPHLKSWAERRKAGVQAVEAHIYSFYHQRRRDFWCSLLLNLVGHAHSILEVYLILWLLGAQPTWLAAFFIEVLTKLVNAAGALIPGNYGAYEGGNMLILSALGLGAETGLTLGLTRRLRGLCWAAVGLTILFFHGLGRRSVAATSDVSLNPPGAHLVME